MTDRASGGEVENVVRLGVLGLGTAGRGAISAAGANPFVKVTAVCDLIEETAQRFGAECGAKSYTSVRALCNDDDVDAVYVSTPTYLHLANALELARAGKHLMIEKPVVKDRAEADELVRLAEEHGILLMSVNTRGRDAAVRAMARVVGSGAIGRVLSFTNICHTNWVLRPRFGYELVPALGGGVAFRQAPHQVEIARTIVAEPVVAVTALAGESAVPVTTVGNYSALLEFASGVSGTLVYNGYGYFDTAELTFGVGESGRPADTSSSARLRANAAWSADKYGEAGLAARNRGPAGGRRTEQRPWSFVGLTVISGERGDIRQSPKGVTVYDENGQREEDCLNEKGGLAVDFAEFYDALRGGKALEHDATWGATTVKICQAIWTSHNERRRVLV